MFKRASNRTSGRDHLEKKLKEIAGQIGDLAIKIKEFSSSNDQRLSLEELEALKISDAKNLLTRHIVNLKPLVGFNTVKAHTLSLELLDRLKDMPTIGELDSSGSIRMRLYRPGQYKVKGVEKFAEKLFVSKYGARSPNVTFLLDRIRDDVVQLKLKRANIFFKIPLDSLILSLRTYSAVKHLDISNEEEFGIVDPAPIEEHILRLSGLIPREKVEQASKDIQEAHNDFAGNILLTRRIRLTSPNAYWLTFYSDNAVLGSQLPTIQVRDVSQAKMLALYLNSTLCLLQLISFAAETEGAWVSLDHKRVWSLIHVPDIENLKPAIVNRVLNLLSKVGKIEVGSLFERVKNHDKIQKSIDEMALEMIGLEDWKDRLDELYDAVAAELQYMQKILETSRRKK